MSNPSLVESSPPRSSHEVFQLLKAGALVRPDQLSTLKPDDFSTAEEMAFALRDRGLLTPFQCQVLLEGKAEHLQMGNYVLRDLLGQGGMGQVFLATHKHMQRDVAVKILPLERIGRPEALARFQREVQIAGRMSHPNLVVAHDAGQEGDVAYLVMEYVPGRDLASILTASGALPPELAVECTVQACAGLAAAHAEGIIHRDIKPGNLMASRKGIVKVLDLGLAFLREPDDSAGATVLSQSGIVLGTPDYMAPEQTLNARETTSASDQYSLGCTLYSLLTGRKPFDEPDVMSVLIAHRESTPPTPESLGIELPEGLSVVVQKAMAKKPDDRYPDMHAFASALEPFRNADAVQTLGQLAALPSTPEIDTETFIGSLSGSRTAVPDHPLHPAAPSPPRQGKLVRPVGRGVLIGIVLLLFVGVALGIYLTIKTEKATIQIEVTEPGASIIVDDKKHAVVTSKDGKTIYRLEVDPGRHTLRVQKGDTVFYTREVTLTSGEESELLKAKYVPLTKIANPAPPSEAAINDPKVLTVSQDGRGRFRSINEALRHIKPGMTLRILDGSVYREPLMLQDPSTFRDVTIESPRGATLTGHLRQCIILNVPGVTLRGLKFDLASSPNQIDQITFGILVGGRSPGVLLENLIFRGTPGQHSAGVEPEGLNVTPSEKPLIIRNCQFHSLEYGVRPLGLWVKSGSPFETSGVQIVENFFGNCNQSIAIAGDCRRVLVAGNIIVGALLTGLQVEALTKDCQIVMVNNSLFQSGHELRIWDEGLLGTVVFRNNLLCDADGADALYIDSGGNHDAPRGPGDGPSVLKRWDWSGNARERGEPTLSPFIPLPESWMQKAPIPVAKTDLQSEAFSVLSRTPGEPNFLKPSETSRLAKVPEEARHEALPPYIGAVPPKQTNAWDWNRTWDHFMRDKKTDPQAKPAIAEKPEKAER